MLAPVSDRGLEARDSLSDYVQLVNKPAKQAQLLEGIFKAISPDPEHEPDAADGGLDLSGPTLHILLVEDGFVNREVALGFLDLAGHRVETAENGLEALAALEHQSFDIVLMDVEMPLMDGLEATREIRRREAESGGDRVPIIAMTAHAVQGYRDRCLEAGMDAYISKPIWPEELFAALKTAAASRPAIAEPTPAS
jgi:CheY-like chemotaxis protein